MASRLSLRSRGTIWVLAAMLAGGVAVWLFMASQAAWRGHLDRAYIAGLALYDTLDSGAPAPAGLTVTPVPDLPALPNGWRETTIPLIGANGPPGQSQSPRLSVRIQSPQIVYPVAEVSRIGGGTPAAGLANITRILASYCSDPLLFARRGVGPWQRVTGASLWGCAAAPPDRRLWAVLIAGAALIILLAQVAETAGAFAAFANALREHRNPSAMLPESGPVELRQTAAAVNAFLEQDRAALANRAMLLSGISHDLGTPATRLRLRSTLIDDPDLRARLENDIDEMTGMIDSVLTYTRAEIGAEPPRDLSLAALVEAVIDDYRDVGLPVQLRHAPAPSVIGAGTVFTRRRPTTEPEAARILMRGQPTALRRALSNLIDNALKYGREATVTLAASADQAHVTVTDRGSMLTAEEIARLVTAFDRGQNSAGAPGYGLGLAIVSTVAVQHGGGLSFDATEGGLSVRLTLARNRG